MEVKKIIQSMNLDNHVEAVRHIKSLQVGQRVKFTYKASRRCNSKKYTVCGVVIQKTKYFIVLNTGKTIESFSYNGLLADRVEIIKEEALV
jgi:hypothetical protein